jgi:hypothetical protein
MLSGNPYSQKPATTLAGRTEIDVKYSANIQIRKEKTSPVIAAFE